MVQIALLEVIRHLGVDVKGWVIGAVGIGGE